MHESIWDMQPQNNTQHSCFLWPRPCHSEPNVDEGGSLSHTSERKGETGYKFTRTSGNLLISCPYKPSPLSNMFWKCNRWWSFSEGFHLTTATSKHHAEWKKGSRGYVSWPAQRPREATGERQDNGTCQTDHQSLNILGEFTKNNTFNAANDNLCYNNDKCIK